MENRLSPKKIRLKFTYFSKEIPSKKLALKRFPFCKFRLDTGLECPDTGNFLFVNIVARRAAMS